MGFPFPLSTIMKFPQGTVEWLQKGKGLCPYKNNGIRKLLHNTLHFMQENKQLCAKQWEVKIDSFFNLHQLAFSNCQGSKMMLRTGTGRKWTHLQ